MEEDSRQTPGWPERLPHPVTLATALVAVVLAFVALQPEVTGLFRDDGIYVGVAQSLADREGYRLAHLPGDPAQTKYPPLYSGLLAGLLAVAPEFPAAIGVLKATGPLLLGALVLLVAGYFRERFGDLDPALHVAVALTGFNVIAFSLADLLLTDLLFACLVFTALRAGERLSATPVADRRISLRAGVVLGSICGLALLARQAAAPLIVAGGLPFLLRRDRVGLAGFVALAAPLSIAWVGFKLRNGLPTDANVLLLADAGYEPSVIALLPALGASALGIVLDNARYVLETVDRSLFLPILPPLRWLVWPLLVLGAMEVFRRPLGMTHTFVALYLGLVLLWPFHPVRYLLPLLPFAYAALARGATMAVSQARRLTGRGGHRVAGAVVAGTLGLVVLSGGIWLADYTRDRPDELRGWFGGRLPYGWGGFEETFEWIGDQVPRDAVLASGHDALFHLYTDRDAVRPWLHRPWTYYYPRSAAEPNLGELDTLVGALDELGVSFVILSPLDGYEEGPAAERLMEEILDLYSGLDGRTPVLRFTSSDGVHRVYEIPAGLPSEPSPSGETGRSAAS